MPTKLDTGGPADTVLTDDGIHELKYEGETWLDRRAGQAMTSLIANEKALMAIVNLVDKDAPAVKIQADINTLLAAASYQVAQAMLARKRKIEGGWK